MELIIGSHVSYKNDTQLLGSIKEALSYGANTFMFYTGAPTNTIRKDIEVDYTKEAIKLMEFLLKMVIEKFIWRQPLLILKI